MLSFTIDWFSITFKKETQDGQDFLCRYASSTPIVPDTPHNGYTASNRDANGVLQMWNDNRSEMGLHVVFSGSSLTRLASQDGWHVVKFVSEAFYAGASVSRLDLAVDATDEQINLDKVWEAIQTGKRLGSTRTFSRLESSGNGYTIYCGSRQSERFIRIYDKAAQIGAAGRDWKRYELELKGDVAKAICAQITASNCGALFQTLAKDMVDLPECEHYQQFFFDSAPYIGLPKIEKQTDREKWIASQVTPAIGQHYIEHPESQAVADLIALLTYLTTHR